jgi:hypothetical protein
MIISGEYNMPLLPQIEKVIRKVPNLCPDCHIGYLCSEDLPNGSVEIRCSCCDLREYFDSDTVEQIRKVLQDYLRKCLADNPGQATALLKSIKASN